MGIARSPEAKSGDATLLSPFYRNSFITDKYNQLTFNTDKNWKIEFRAYIDGVAYRWIYTGENPVNVVDEKVLYSFDSDALATVGYIREDRCNDLESQFFNSFENEYVQFRSPSSTLNAWRFCHWP